MSEIFGAAGQIAAASISAAATREATEAQIKALEKQRKFVYNELDPTKIGGAALEADTARAQNRLALQAITDPELLRQRYAAQAAQSAILGDITSGESAGDVIGRQAAAEAQAAGPRMLEAKNALIDAALAELKLGASLPPDLQAELVQTGLQRSGGTTGRAGGAGFGGQILTNVLGSAGIALQKQRQDQAAGLLGQAQNLENSRASILGGLFPALNTQQQNKLAATSGVLAQSDALVPEAGIGGSSVANLWLARVGATNQLAQQAANAAAAGGQAQAYFLNQGIGGATRAIAPALPTTASAFKGIFGGGGGGQQTEDEWLMSIGAL
jgi:hypothetical protein